MKQILPFILLILTLGFIPTHSHAIMIIPDDLEGLAKSSEVIVDGKVVDVVDLANGVDYTIEVANCLKGECGEFFTLRLFGSRFNRSSTVKQGRMIRRVAGSPVLPDDFQGTLFLSKENSRGFRSIVNMDQGIFTKKIDSTGKASIHNRFSRHYKQFGGESGVGKASTSAAPRLRRGEGIPADLFNSTLKGIVDQPKVEKR